MGFESIENYLAQVPTKERAALKRVHKVIKGAAPDTTETISYQMPTFKYRGKALVGYAAFKDHCSLFPYSKGVMATLKRELEPFDIEGQGATIRFTTDEPLPDMLVRKIVQVRMKEIESGPRRKR